MLKSLNRADLQAVGRGQQGHMVGRAAAMRAHL